MLCSGNSPLYSIDTIVVMDEDGGRIQEPPTEGLGDARFSKSKTIFIAVGLAGCLIVGLAIFAWNQKKSTRETTEEGWSFYKKSSDFSFQYPAGLKPLEGGGENIRLPRETIRLEGNKGGIIFIIPLQTQGKKQGFKFSFLKKAEAASATPKITMGSREGEQTVVQNATRSPNVELFFETPTRQREMMVSDNENYAGALWEPYSAIKPWAFFGGDGEKRVFAKFKDENGQITEGRATFLLDTLPPIGGMAIDRRVIGPAIITTTIYLGAEDNLSGVNSMRISKKADFSDFAPWRPYETILTWAVDPDKPHGTTETLYVQYRDLAGNSSEVFNDSYTVDRLPPVIYVEVEKAPKNVFRRKVFLYGYDELADLNKVQITNDPRFVDEVTTLPYQRTNIDKGRMDIDWTFDERRVVWVKVQDSVGNWTKEYPAYGGTEPGGETTPTPSPAPTPKPMATLSPTPTLVPEGTPRAKTPPPSSAPETTPTPLPLADREFMAKAAILEERVKNYWPEAKKKRLTKEEMNDVEAIRAIYREQASDIERKGLTLTMLTKGDRSYLIVVSGDDAELLQTYEKILESFRIIGD